MAEIRLRKKLTLKNKVDRFLFSWHQFPIDYWWRKKYKVPFGSPQHRAMNFIDMFIEFQEEADINRVIYNADEEFDELGIKNERTVRLTDEEINNDFDELDLSQFDKK